MLFSVLFIRTPLKSLEFYLFQPLGHGHAVQNCSPQLVNCCEEDNYKMLIIIFLESGYFHYQKKSSATNQGDEFYFCSADAEMKSENTHDHLHVKCKF